MCELSIPNREITYVYNKEILERMSPMIPQATAIDIQVALYTGNSAELKKKLEKLLLQSVSFYDVAKENFYHGFMLGLCATMDNRYEISSNRESGEGRFDICMEPKKKGLPASISSGFHRNHAEIVSIFFAISDILSKNTELKGRTI